MQEQIEKVLDEKVNPILASHGGGAILTAFEDDVAWVRLTGACAACLSAQSTVEDVIKTTILENCEGVRDVALDTSVSQDLLDMARKILNKEI